MDQNLEKLAIAIDNATVSKDEALLLKLAETCLSEIEAVTGPNRSLLYYLRANCFAGSATVKYNTEYAWSWKQAEATDELLSLRAAVSDPSFEQLESIRKYQILTNLASRLNSLGRSVEAIEIWDKAISLYSKGAMANGNRGICLTEFGRALYDPGHTEIYWIESARSLEQAISPIAIWDSGPDERAAQAFRRKMESIVSTLEANNMSLEYDADHPRIPTKAPYRRYHEWCLDNRLFLNPLNDLMSRADSLYSQSYPAAVK